MSFYRCQQELGAFFLEGAAGWERPYWYESNAVRLRDNSVRTWCIGLWGRWPGTGSSP